MHIIAIVSSVILIVGCFMPWLQLGAIFQNRGIDSLDGGILLTAGIISAAVAIYNQNKQENKLTWIYLAVGALGLIIVLFDLPDAQNRAREAAKGLNNFRRAFGETEDVSNLNFIGSGLYIVAFSSIGLLLTGLGVFDPNQENNKLKPLFDRLNEFKSKSTHAEPVKPTDIKDETFVAPENFVEEEQIIEEEPTLEEEPIVEELDPVEKRNKEYQEQVMSLRQLVINEKKALFGSPNKDEIISLLKELCTSHKNALYLIDRYKQHFGSDLIDDLKKLSSSYRGIKEYMTPFIALEIVASEHPHHRT